MVWPRVDSPVFRTPNGTEYLKSPGLVTIGQTACSIEGMASFLNDYGMGGYLSDYTELLPAEQLCKTSGQVCYASFGDRRTRNDEAGRYFRNIIDSGHHSVLEHGSVSFFIYGVSRSLTHELVRHRHCSFSQLSQRYADKVRFVQRPEFAGGLQNAFEARIDRTLAEYQTLRSSLSDGQQCATTDGRKAVNQASRAVLTNEVETFLVVTANHREWRHFVNVRSSEHAEPEIRRLTELVLGCLKQIAPALYQDL